MKKINVSIIIPVYNIEDYIVECLQSVANQTMADGVECILVDDCGQDNSVRLATDFIEDYHGPIRFSLLHHEHNEGLSGARNTGIRAAKGEYVYFLDSDDYITLDCIKQLWTLVLRYHPDLVAGAYSSTTPLIKRLNGIRHPELFPNRKIIKKSLLNYDVLNVMAQNRLVNRRLICDCGLFFKPGIIHEDNYWTFFLAKHVGTMAYCNKPVYYYRQTPGSITHAKDKEKETKAFTTMIADFCSNIDSFERGAQLRYIFCHLLTAVDCGYFQNEEQKRHLLDRFISQNSLLVRPLLKTIFRLSPQSGIRSRLIRAALKYDELSN